MASILPVRRLSAVTLALSVALAFALPTSPALAASTNIMGVDENAVFGTGVSDLTIQHLQVSNHDPASISLAWTLVNPSTNIAVASGATYADALALGQYYIQPILVDPAIGWTHELQNMLTLKVGEEVSVIGGAKAVSPAIEANIKTMGFKTRRISGPSRTETSIALSRENMMGNDVVLVRGQGEGSAAYADSLAAGTFANNMNAQLVINTASPSAPLHPAIRDYLKEFEADHVYIVGGAQAVSPETEQAVRDLGIKVTRIAGASRVETALALANETMRAGTGAYTGATLINGYAKESGWVNGLVSANYTAERNAVTLLVGNVDVHPEVLDFLKAIEPEGNLMAGTEVNPEMVQYIADEIGGDVAEFTLETSNTKTSKVNTPSDQLFWGINAVRDSYGLKPLRKDPALQAYAETLTKDDSIGTPKGVPADWHAWTYTDPKRGPIKVDGYFTMHQTFSVWEVLKMSHTLDDADDNVLNPAMTRMGAAMYLTDDDNGGNGQVLLGK